MNRHIEKLLQDDEKVALLRKGLPPAFEIVKKEMPPGNPAVGLLREDAIIGFLMHTLGAENVEKAASGTDRGYDLTVHGQRLSIKTVTEKGQIKILWTADTSRIEEEIGRRYMPEYDILLVRIHWGESLESFFYIPKEAQIEVMRALGRDGYLKASVGTNHRGISITSRAINLLLKHQSTIAQEIDWMLTHPDHDPIRRWKEFWRNQGQKNSD